VAQPERTSSTAPAATRAAWTWSLVCRIALREDEHENYDQ
jgi:hypothetical protein